MPALGFFLLCFGGVSVPGYVINAAGTHSDEVARMIGDDSIKIVARKGEYYPVSYTHLDVYKRQVMPAMSDGSE